ncbi:MAG: hypothetical protein ABIR63_00370 [Sphingomicrobium sp.]
MVDDAVWKKRFALFTLVRLAGVAIFLLGVAIAYFDVIRPGGWPQLGAIIALTGMIDAILVPRLLRKTWDRQDR